MVSNRLSPPCVPGSTSFTGVRDTQAPQSPTRPDPPASSSAPPPARGSPLRRVSSAPLRSLLSRRAGREFCGAAPGPLYPSWVPGLRPAPAAVRLSAPPGEEGPFCCVSIPGRGSALSLLPRDLRSPELSDGNYRECAVMCRKHSCDELLTEGPRFPGLCHNLSPFPSFPNEVRNMF